MNSTTKFPNSFLKLPHCLLRSPLWRNLLAVDRAVYVDVAGLYDGRNNGEIPYSARYGAIALHIRKDTVSRSLKRLELCQLIRCTRRGTNRHQPSLWHLPFCGQLEQTENPSVSPGGRKLVPNETLGGVSVSPGGQTVEKKKNLKGDSRAKRREAPVNNKREAEQREADLLLLGDYRRRAEATKAAAHGGFAAAAVPAE